MLGLTHKSDSLKEREEEAKKGKKPKLIALFASFSRFYFNRERAMKR